MSIKVMTHVWESSAALGNRRLVMLALADFANDDGWCWPSIPILANKTRVSERTVQRILRELEKAGEIQVVEGGGRGKSSHYRVLTKPRQPVTLSEKGDNPAQETVTPEAQKGDRAMSPEPLINHHIEPPLRERGRKRPNTPPAVELLRRITHRYPPKKFHATIDRVIGRTFAALLRWGRIVRKWILNGYNPTNYNGMLDVYRGGWIHSQQRNPKMTPGLQAVKRAHDRAGIEHGQH